MKKIFYLILLLFPMTSAFALHCPYGHEGQRFLSVKLLSDKVICHYDNYVDLTISGSFERAKPRFWYTDIDGGYMCLGIRDCQFFSK